MSKDKYIPQPVDISDVILPDDITEIAEQIARNVHEVWAKSRIDQGWKYGEQRDDDKKTHPCLVPYDELPESEKDYDRDTCINTIKMMMKLGFRMTRES
ncbi:MAG: Ryanodine receptor Ryr [Bacteroidaceae bacterium]|nr:Ryanodine receptor Ryr [Bacteroidaceae bacterium]